MQFKSFNFIYSIYAIQVIENEEAIKATIVSQTPQLFPIQVNIQAISNYFDRVFGCQLAFSVLRHRIDNNYN